MKKLPLLPTLIVGLACATMVGLGIWQLQRAQWKGALIAIYAAAHGKPPMAFPSVPYPEDLPLFRRASANCLSVTGWTATSGRNLKGESGWAHIAQCTTGAEGPGVNVVAGWSRTPDNPDWKGGTVSGIIAPDSKALIRLVSDVALAPGLEASTPPRLDDIPNNHFGYAVQWFIFAALAALIYALALRRRDPRA